MAEHAINKGIGRSAEFQGLKSQYLFLFAGGLLGLFVLVVVFYMAGFDSWFCLSFGIAASSLLVWGTFRLNARFGEWGLMKLQARHSRPHSIISRRRLDRLFPSIVKSVRS